MAGIGWDIFDLILLGMGTSSPKVRYIPQKKTSREMTVVTREVLDKHGQIRVLRTVTQKVKE